MSSAAGMDYTAVSQTVIFVPGQTTAGVTIPLLNSEIPPQSNISFTTSLIPNPNVIILGDNPVVTIADNSGKHQILVVTVEFMYMGHTS